MDRSLHLGCQPSRPAAQINVLRDRPMLSGSGSLCMVFACLAIVLIPSAHAADPALCVSLNYEHNSTFLVNDCNTAMNVRWFDDGDCATGCAAMIPATSREIISSARGTVRVAACVYPALVNPEWQGHGPYHCP